jgi:hypothetical protein
MGARAIAAGAGKMTELCVDEIKHLNSTNNLNSEQPEKIKSFGHGDA